VIRNSPAFAGLGFLLLLGLLAPHPGFIGSGILPGMGASESADAASSTAVSGTYTAFDRTGESRVEVADATPTAELDTRSPASLHGIRILQDDILGMVRAGGRASSEWGVLAVSLESGETLVELNPGIALAPASNQKLVTSAAALDILGPTFRFPTYLLLRGPVENGVLHGDLVVFGTGDPSLGLEDPSSPEGAYAFFLEALRAEGITEIRGDIVGDGSFFAGDRRRPSWNPRDLNDWYAAPVSSLSFNQNVVTLRVRPGTAAGTAPRVLSVPAGAGIPVANQGLTVSQRPSPSLLMVRDDPDEPLEIRGQIHVNGGDVWRRITVSDPPAYAASILRETLVRSGIEVSGGARGVAGDDPGALARLHHTAPVVRSNGDHPTRTLAVHHSEPLPELLNVVNKRSHNLYAELLLFTLGRISGDEGSFRGGSGAITHYLTTRVGIPENEIHVEDGSGLSHLNRITPSALVATMAHMEASPHRDYFWASLPEAGNPRELNRMNRTPAARNLRAKTGTIQRTSALSGVVRTAGGEPILFSIMVNGMPSTSTAKRIEDRIGIALAGFQGSLLPSPSPGIRTPVPPANAIVADH
jgi:serine-type D-Ala-D-Ala carboxypeptidase/endopeptidase (penicillin-binding protein 4)